MHTFVCSLLSLSWNLIIMFSKRTLMSVCVSDTEEDIETGGTTDVTIPESKKHPPPESSTGVHIT